MPRRALVTLILAGGLAAVSPAAVSAAYTVSGPASIAEGAGSATYTVNRDALDPLQATVTVTGSGGAPATAGKDVGAPNPAQLDFGGLGPVTVQVPIINDAEDEPDEAYTVTVTGSDGQTTGSAPTTITDDDVTVDATPATATEGAAATVTLTPRAAPAHELRVDYATLAGTASAADFTPAQGTITWAAGDASPKTIAVATTADALDENDESLGLLLASPTDTVAAPAVAVTIADDDAPPLVGAVPTKVTEGASGTRALQILVALAQPSGRVVRVPYGTRDGTARAPGDYTPATGTLSFNPGETAKAVTVRVAGDRTAEPDETFMLALGPPENAALAPRGGAATITITDDDGGGGAVGAGADSTPPRLAFRSLIQSATGVIATLHCPTSETSCRGTLTLFTVANRRSTVKALRSERRLGRATYRLAGKATKRVTLRLKAADRRLLRGAGSVRVRVRAFAVTSDAAGNVADASRSATLRFG